MLRICVEIGVIVLLIALGITALVNMRGTTKTHSRAVLSVVIEEQALARQIESGESKLPMVPGVTRNSLTLGRRLSNEADKARARVIDLLDKVTFIDVSGDQSAQRAWGRNYGVALDVLRAQLEIDVR